MESLTSDYEKLQKINSRLEKAIEALDTEKHNLNSEVDHLHREAANRESILRYSVLYSVCLLYCYLNIYSCIIAITIFPNSRTLIMVQKRVDFRQAVNGPLVYGIERDHS